MGGGGPDWPSFWAELLMHYPKSKPMTTTTQGLGVPLWRSYDNRSNNPKQPSGQAWVLSSTRLWPLDPSGEPPLKHRPGGHGPLQPHPSMAVLGGLLLRLPRSVQGLGKPYSKRGNLSGVDQ